MADVERLFADHAQPLYRYLVHLTGDADAAADGVQTAFTRALEQAPNAVIERAWLFRVATNSVLEELRTSRRRGRILAAHTERAPIADAGLDPLERVEALERHQHASRALASLSEKERSAVLIREAGFAHREIAEALDTTTGSVGTLIARALDKFAAALGPSLTRRPE